MSVHYLLDGYNIIKQTPGLNRGTLEEQRQALLHWINIDRPQGSVHNSVTVVFDGKEEFFSSYTEGVAKVFFSKGQSADDLIKKMIEQSTAKKSWVVVSNDKDIKFYVRALGAHVLSVKEFTMVDSNKSKQSVAKNQPPATAGKYISLTLQVKINQESERIWGKSKS